MKIALVYDGLYPDRIGGVEKRDAGLAAALAERGWEPTLVGPLRSPGEFRSPRRVVDLGRPPRATDARGDRRLAAALWYRRALARFDPRGFDLVEVAALPYVQLAPLARRCRAAGVPLWVSWYEFWGAAWRERKPPGLGLVYQALERRYARRFGDRRIASSRLTAGRLRAATGREAAVLPVGVEVEAIGAAADAAAPGTPFVAVGRLIADKRIDLALAALARLGESREPLLTVIGDGPERARLERLALELGVASRVVWRGWLAADAAVWRAIGGATALVHPSAREGFGIAPLEAMAAGRAVVCCAAPESAVPELVDDGVTGWVTASDPEAFAMALRRLLADPAGARALGAAGRRRAADYRWSEIASRCAALVETGAEGLVGAPEAVAGGRGAPAR